MLDQADCGSCWAFSVTGALTDRYCIWSGGRLFSHTSVDDSASLSPQPLLSCGEPDGACDGGSEGHAWEFMKQNGTLTCRRKQTQYGVTCDSGCAPYQSASCGEGGDPFHNGCAECQRDVCNDGGGTPVDWTPELWANTTDDSDAPHMVFYADEIGSVGSGQSPDAPKPKAGDPKPKPKPDVEAIQTEVMTNGPVSTCFRFYESFHTFFNDNPAGIYNNTGMCKNKKTGKEEPCKEVGGHCVKIVGWGHDDPSGIDYWLIANSWTTNWGTHGYFRFKRGTDLCKMDGSCWAGCPPADLSAGVANAPGEKCMLTAPNTSVAVFGEAPEIVGGEWVEHDVTDETLAGTMFVADTIDAIVADAHHHVKKALSRVDSERKAELLGVGAHEAWHQRVAAVRTQVTRGINVRMDLAIDESTTLRVHCLHDALKSEGTKVTKAHVV